MSDTKLTAKQEAFCLAMLETESASAAYRKAYSAAKMAEPTVHREASVLLANPKITARVAALRAEAAAKTVLSEAWVIERLMRNVEVSLGDKKVAITVRPKARDGQEGPPVTVEVTERDPHAANRALELLGKKLGLFTDKHEVTGPEGGPLRLNIEEMNEGERARRLALILMRGAEIKDKLLGKLQGRGQDTGRVTEEDAAALLTEEPGALDAIERAAKLATILDKAKQRQEESPPQTAPVQQASVVSVARGTASAAPEPPPPPKPVNPYSALNAADDFNRTVARDLKQMKKR